jgi:GNAT superfamily N-acetyltransferase
MEELTPNLNSEVINKLEKEIVIDQIQEADTLAFKDWIADYDRSKRLRIPQPALRHFIPRKVLELADDPTQVNIVNLEDNKSYGHILKAIIYEHKDAPVTNLKSFEDYTAYLLKAKHERPKFRIPDDIDEFHLTNHSLLTSGIIGINDFVTNEFVLLDMDDEDVPTEILTVSEYSDREELRGKGIGKAFYSQLREIAKSIGYRYITGSNNDTNISFFLNTLGRYTLPQIKSEHQRKFTHDPDDEVNRNFTVDILYPEDKELYLNI